MTLEPIRSLVVIPLYNHGATVRAVAEQTLVVHDQVLVVDDGSNDDGAATLAGLPLQLLRHEVNRGKGVAIMTAAGEARRRGFTHIITLDADGQHNPADIPVLLAVLAGDPRAIVVGKRDFSADNVPGSSRFGRVFSNFWLRLQTGVSLADTQCGFRIYPLAVLEGLSLWSSRYTFEVEILVRAAWAGVPLKDPEISVYYPPRNERISHFRGVLDNARLTLLNTHLTMRSIVPWPHRKLYDDPHTVVARFSMLHPWRSLRTLLTENTSPARLAAAGALGVLLGTLPLLALHTVAILFAAAFLRLNKVAAIGASQLCMPPLVPAICIEFGYYLRHGRFLTDLSLETLGRQGFERLWEWLLGALLVGPLLGLLVGLGFYLMAVLIRREARGAN